VFARVIALDPYDASANAGLGKMALFRDSLADADTLLARALARDRDPETVRDLYAARLRQDRWADAAALAEEAGEAGRREALLAQAETPPCAITAGPDEDHIPFAVTFPVPCVRVRIDGESVLLAIDTGARELLLDDHVARRVRLRVRAEQVPLDWMGHTQTVTVAVTPTMQIGRFTLADVPTGLLNLRKYGLSLNPRSEPVVGVIGLQMLRAFVPTFDYHRNELVLRRPSAPATPVAAKAVRIPFEIRGEADMFVHAELAGGRAMALEVHSGIPECGVMASEAVFTEVGLKAGTVSRMMGSANSWIQGNPWARVAVPSVVLGGVVQSGVPGWAVRGEGIDLWRDGVRSDGFVSHDLFRGWRVTYDWAARQMVFEPKE